MRKPLCGNCNDCFLKSFASHPKSEYYSSKNELDPKLIYKGSKKKCIFDCPTCNHEFTSSIETITKMNCWCSYCGKKKLCTNNNCQHCYQNSLASIENIDTIFDYENNKKSPRQIFKRSAETIHLKCINCSHKYSKKAQKLKKKNFENCKYCINSVCGLSNCQQCFNRSFASHPKSKYIVDKSIDPFTLTLNSNKSVLFNCEICNHDFKAIIQNVVRHNNWCSYCGGNKLCNNESCIPCYNKSLASFSNIELVFNYNTNTKIPRQIFRHAKEKVNLVCYTCSHNYSRAVHKIKDNNWNKCRYCTYDVCGQSDCNKCFERSFASHPKSIWVVDKEIDLSLICNHSHKKLGFLCEKCNLTFQARISDVTYSQRWCPYCKKKTEGKVLQMLQQYIKFIKPNKSFLWCRNNETNRPLPFDIFIIHPLTGHNIIIEIDGKQHFEEVSFFKKHNVEMRQNRDKYKMHQAVKRGYKFIRILQEPIWKDQVDWETILLEAIEELVSTNRMTKYIDFDTNTYSEHHYYI